MRFQIILVFGILLFVVMYSDAWWRFGSERRRRGSPSIQQRMRTARTRSYGRRESSRNQKPGKSSSGIDRLQSQCAAKGCCWDNKYNCHCPSRKSYGHFRYKRNRGVRVEYKDTSSGCECTGDENNSHGGRSYRPFKVNCKINRNQRRNNKNACQTVHNSCIYNGNPHDCKKYNKNQEQFYNQLIKIIAPVQCNNLNLEGAPCENKEESQKTTEEKTKYNAPMCDTQHDGNSAPYVFERVNPMSDSG